MSRPAMSLLMIIGLTVLFFVLVRPDRDGASPPSSISPGPAKDRAEVDEEPGQRERHDAPRTRVAYLFDVSQSFNKGPSSPLGRAIPKLKPSIEAIQKRLRTPQRHLVGVIGNLGLHQT